MSLDDLLPLLLVAAFVINAVLRGRRASQRGRRAPPQQGRRPAPPARPTADGSGRDPGTPQASAAGRSGDAPPAQDELTRRLEEARRRVREATGSASTGTRADAGTAPSAGGSGGGRPPAATAAPTPPRTATPRTATPPPGFLGREGAAPRASQTAAPDGFLGREGPPPTPRAARRPGGDAGRRGQEAPSARLPAANVLGLGPEDVVRGVMWSVVLGEPVSNRLRRRKVSQRRSP